MKKKQVKDTSKNAVDFEVEAPLFDAPQSEKRDGNAPPTYTKSTSLGGCSC